MQFTVNERKIKCEDVKSLIGDNADYTITFDFDAEWEGQTKTARFMMKNKYVDRILEDDTCIIPVEILKQGFLSVGVYTDKITSTICEIPVKPSIKEKNGNVAEPSDDVYSQIIHKLEVLEIGSVSNERVAEVVSTYAQNADKLAGKKIACFGDSLMASKDAINNNAYNETYGWNGGYPKKIKEAHPKAKVYNFAIPNGALCTNTIQSFETLGQSTGNIFDVLKEKLVAITDVDYILINGCGNDIYIAGMQGKNLVVDLFGTPNKSIPTSAKDDNTICGALELMFDWLTTNYPKTKIIYLSLPPIKQFHSVPTMYNSEIENTLIEYLNKICKKYGVTFVDLCNTILKRDLFLDSGFFYANDVHLTNDGYSAVADLIDSVF